MEAPQVTLGIIPHISTSRKEELLQALRNRKISPRNKSKKCLIQYASFYNKKYIRRLQFQLEDTSEIISTPLTVAEAKPLVVQAQESTKIYDLTSWKTKYNGLTDVEDFINRVEETALVRGIPESILHKNFIDLIAPEMLTWHRIQKRKTNSWQELRTALLTNFGEKKAQHRVRLSLLAIKQYPGEPVARFTQRAEAINIKLTQPVPEGELLPVLIDGLLPKYENIITSQKISTLEQLKDVCQLLEAYQDRKRDERFPKENLLPSTSSGIKPEHNDKKSCSFCHKVGHSQATCFKQAKLLSSKDPHSNKRRSTDRSPKRDDRRKFDKRPRQDHTVTSIPDLRFIKPPMDFSRPPPNWTARKTKN